MKLILILVLIILQFGKFVFASDDETTKNQNKIIENQQKIINNLSAKLNSALYHLTGEVSDQELNPSILIENKYKLLKISLPFGDYYSQGSKPIGFLDRYGDSIFLATGNGLFFKIDKHDFDNKKPRISLLQSNFFEIISNSFFDSDNGAHSIKDILILGDELLVSYTHEKSPNCFNLSIIAAKIDSQYLSFYNAFQFDECSNDEKTNPHMGGGRMVKYVDNKILLSVGSYGVYKYPQDKNSIFGKLLSLDLENNTHELVSIGHRNPQGLYYQINDDVIILTEHGPKGGDEINILIGEDKEKPLKNYGWPIASYGNHYDGKFRDDAPLYKSHSDFGFIEPIIYYTPSIALSEIIKFPGADTKNDFLISTLGYSDSNGRQSLHYIEFDKSYQKILNNDVWYIGDRIRDIMILDKKFVVMILEGDHLTQPSIGVLELI